MVLHINHVASKDDVEEIRQVFNACGIPVFLFDRMSTEVRAITHAELSEDTFTRLAGALESAGHPLVRQPMHIIAAQIKAVIREAVPCSQLAGRHFDFPALLSERLHYNYRYLSRMFSRAEGMSIERYIIRHKIECVKRMVREGTSLTDIAFELNYSSISHLSKQFKATAGMTITEFRGEITNYELRITNDKLGEI